MTEAMRSTRSHQGELVPLKEVEKKVQTHTERRPREDAGRRRPSRLRAKGRGGALGEPNHLRHKADEAAGGTLKAFTSDWKLPEQRDNKFLCLGTPATPICGPLLWPPVAD